MGFVEVADRVWVARYESYDVNVTAVGGARGLVVVDTHASTSAAAGVLSDLSGLGLGEDAGEVVAVVNTHDHVDHVLGNGAFRSAYPQVPIHAHEAAAAAMPAAQTAPPDHVLSSVSVIDLGDRAVELVHPGRGHTAGDLVVRVPDADVLLAGDLVESSTHSHGGDRAMPGLGDDCFPMDWPLTLDFVLQLLTADTVVVPGHGAPVDRGFVHDQRADLGVVAETIRDLAGRGVPLDEALAAAEWPWPAEHLDHAVRRGYDQLPRSQKRLPLV